MSRMSSLHVVILLNICLTLAAAQITGSGANKENLKKANKYFFGEYQTKTGATPGDIESLRMRKIPNTRTGLCFLQCIFNVVKIMEDGKFNRHGMIVAFTPFVKGDMDKFGKLKELSSTCETELGDKDYENCKGSKLVVECVARHGKEYGIAFPSSKNM